MTSENALTRKTFTTKGEQKVREILEAAVDIIASEGIDGLTFEKLAGELRTHKGHVRYYFQNMEEVFYATVQHVVGQAQGFTVKKITPAKDWKDQIIAIIDAAFEWFRVNPHHIAVFLLLQHRCAVQDRYRELYQLLRHTGRQRMMQVFSQPFPSASKTQLEKLATAIQNIYFGYIYDFYSAPNGRTLASVREQVLDLCFLRVSAEISNSRM